MSDKFSRIMFCFKAENPKKWMERLEKAIRLRN